MDNVVDIQVLLFKSVQFLIGARKQQNLKSGKTLDTVEMFCVRCSWSRFQWKVWGVFRWVGLTSTKLTYP